MQRQLAALNLECSFVDAIDKYDIDSKKYRAYIAAKLDIDESIMEYKYETLRDGGFPTLLSHLRAHRKMCEDDVPQACILEDDVYLLPDFPKVLTASQRTPCWDILKLSSYGDTPSSIMRCLLKNFRSPAHLNLLRTLVLIAFMYGYGVMPERVMERIFSKYRYDYRTDTLSSWRAVGLMNYKGYYGKLNLYIVYRLMLQVLHCFFDIWGNHIYFNTAYGKILKRYMNHRRIRVESETTRFLLSRYYAAKLGSPPSRDKSSWHKMTAQHYIAKPAEATVSGGAYMLTREAATVCKQVITDIDVPIQHIDALPYMLHKYKDIELYICFPPCVQFFYRYLLNSSR